jgi:hypothetical protein
MGEVQLQASLSSALDALHERSTNLRRARPPDINVAQQESEPPVRSERLMRRESRIGLRALFTRNKTGKVDKDVEEPSSRITPRPAGIRASLADFGNWPHKLHSSRSEASLISLPLVDTRPTSADLLSPYRPQQGPSSSDKLQQIAPQDGSVAAALWNPPPLFQVYPQAVKHATLPACNISMEALARSSETKNNKLIHGTIGHRIVHLDYASEYLIDAKGETLKKKQRITGLRNSWEWTSKIFVLVTSGYLLQYAAEGSFNRLPEKVLQLTRTSAAYASDLIPGRHWVLQVASTTDADGARVMDPRSLRSKLSIKEKRQVSNMLLVFENPECMDDWLAILRREIESLGGKKKLPETGKLETDDLAAEVKARPSHRAVIVKDPDRFSRIITRDFSYTQENTLVDPSGIDLAISQPRRFSTYSIDNGSPTASMISSDGQRLDNLRDSSSSHRFSYMSSGQRTIITSAGSSPSCSPTRASFCSEVEDPQANSNMPEVRLRPNAAAIVNRRQSMQVLISSFEAPIEPCSRPYANHTSTSSQENEQLGTPSVPNFSVPHAASKRFSMNTFVTNSSSHVPHSLDHERSAKTARKPPPTSLWMSRPLSIVIDQPSPRSPCSPNSLSRSVDSSQGFSLESRNLTAVPSTPPEQSVLNQTRLSRRYSNTALSHPSAARQVPGVVPDRLVPNAAVDITVGTNETGTGIYIPRAASSLDTYGARWGLSDMSTNMDSSYQRSTLLDESRSFQNHPSSLASVDEWKPIMAKIASPVSTPPCSPKRSAPSLRALAQYPRSQFLATDSQGRLITTRKSMPQLTDGPPPAPPPNCALPPLPRKTSMAHRSLEA